MSELTGMPLKKRDYSCEMIATAVLILLSALSHFWYITIVAGVAIAAWQTLRLVGLAVRSSSAARMRSRLLND